MRAWAELELRRRLFGPVSVFGLGRLDRPWSTGKVAGSVVVGTEVGL